MRLTKRPFRIMVLWCWTLSLLMLLGPSLTRNLKKLPKLGGTIEGKIVAGTLVDRARFPSAVQFFNAGGLCAGTILNSVSVLTAAHCFDASKDIDDMAVQIGAKYIYDPMAQVRDIAQYVIHEDYNKESLFACDIALLFLRDPIDFSSKSKKAVLCNNDKWMTTKEKDFMATGWGQLKYGGPVSEKGLMMTHLSFVSSRECGRLHNLSLTPDMFCLYGDGVTDTCKGDSGGGIIWHGLVVGITSHGDGCAKKNKPSIYTNVWFFRKWIENNVEKYIKSYCESQNKSQNK